MTSIAILALAALGPVACEQRTSLIEPGNTDSDTASNEPGTVERAALSVTVELTGEDSSIAERAGFPDGVLPNAQVSIERVGSAETEATAETDAVGRVEFEGLLPGRYQISVLKALTPDQIEQLDPVDRDVTAFGGGELRTVSAPSTDISLQTLAGRRGSLVISEFAIVNPQIPGGSFYRFAHYIEVYNNSDTTIYLDGKVIARGIPWGMQDRNEVFNCESKAEWQLDPDGLWTQRLVESFPGSGTQYPLEPGEAAVIATDAIDHGQFLEGLPDLSNADFEFRGSQDVDNPRVPDMLTLGTEFASIFGHGLLFNIVDEILILSEPLDISTLPRTDIPGVQSPEHWRIPAERIIDVAVVAPTPDVEAGLAEAGFGGHRCPQYTHERFDR